MLDSETRRIRAKQVGMLMQAYRRAFTPQGGSGRLSQEGLLKLMGQVDPIYLERYNHSTVARWESGATRPTEERLKVFGQALNLSDAEVEGLIRLAGIYEERQNGQSLNGSELREGPGEAQVSAGDSSESTGYTPSFFVQGIRFSLSRLVLPGLGVAAIGFALASSGWNATWMMMLYIIVVAGLVLAQGFLRLRRSNELRELYFISVFFLLSSKLLQAPLIRMDPFGYYAIGDFASTPMPYLFSLLTSLLLALAAGLTFDFLWRRQLAGEVSTFNIWQRTACTSFTPLILIYAACLLLTGLGTWIYLLLVFSILGGSFMALLILRDETVSFTQWERRLLLQSGLAVTIVLTAVGGALVVIMYLYPSMMAIPDHTLIRSWEIDFAALGYPKDELMERYRIGAVWSSLATVVYMVVALGGSLLITIYRLGENEQPDPAGNDG